MAEFPSFVTTLSFGKNDPNRVTVAFTAALGAINKGHTAAVILLIEGVELAKTGEADTLNIGEPFRPVKDLLEEYLAAGGQVKVCKACLVHNDIAIDENLLPQAEIIGINEVIDLLDNAKTLFQLN